MPRPDLTTIDAALKRGLPDYSTALSVLQGVMTAAQAIASTGADLGEGRRRGPASIFEKSRTSSAMAMTAWWSPKL